MGIEPQVKGFHHSSSGTISYLVYDAAGGSAVIIDPVLDFDAASGLISTTSADAIVAEAARLNLKIHWVLDTHVHADHISAADHLRKKVGAQVAIGAGVEEVRKQFTSYFPATDVGTADAFDRLLHDGDELAVGDLTIQVLAVPGHTPSCVAYQVGNALFVGDTLFMPDAGTARCDFPGGDSAKLYESIRRILNAPPDTQIYCCHDYGSGRPPAWQTSVREQCESNVHIKDGTDLEHFVDLRNTRDAGLKVPALLWIAVQMNLAAGALPAPEANGISYVRIPLGQSLSAAR